MIYYSRSSQWTLTIALAMRALRCRLPHTIRGEAVFVNLGQWNVC